MSFVVTREQEIGREEAEVDEHGGERRIRSQIAQEVVAVVKEKVSVAHIDFQR